MATSSISPTWPSAPAGRASRRASYLDLEFWHYERRDGLSWYAAMQQIYADEQLHARFTPALALAQGYTYAELRNAGVPQSRVSVLHSQSAKTKHR
jgi:hypothetical protein